MESRRQYRPSLELLEDRWTPAGTVTGSFANGTWTLIGDDQANSIQIDPTTTAGEFTVTGIDTTTVTGVTSHKNVQNIVVKLFGGEDVVTFNSTDLRAKLPGNLIIKGGDDANDVFIDNTVVGKKLTILNDTNTAGTDDFELTDSVVKGQVFVSNGDGDSNNFIYRNTPGTNFIGGLTVLNGTGRDDYTIADTNVAGSILGKNGLPDALNDAGSFEIYNSKNTTGRSAIGGSVSVKYKAGDIGYLYLADADVRGNVRINHGSGATETDCDSFKIAQPLLIRGNLTLLGTGPSVITFGKLNGTASGKGLIVGKNLTIVTGDQADTIDAYRLRVNGATLIQTGGGADTVTIDDSRFLGRSFLSPFGFRLLTGAGNDTVNIETAPNTTAPTKIVGPALVNLGSGDDTLTTGFGGDATRRVQLSLAGFLLGGRDSDTLNRFNLVSVLGFPIRTAFETVHAGIR